MSILGKILNNKGVRFILVGLFNTGLDFGIYAALVWFDTSPYIANYVSTTVAMISSFYMNRNYTFKPEGATKKREVFMFFAVTTFGLWVLQPLTILGVRFVLESIVRSDYVLSLLAKLVATAVSLTWNYLLYSRVVFVTGSKSK